MTHLATRQLLDLLESLGDVRTELLFLSDFDVGLCRGCKACFIRGEELCPLHDDRDLLIYPTRLGPLKRAAGAAFDRLAARSSRAKEHRAPHH